jgi:hypothetical protein
MPAAPADISLMNWRRCFACWPDWSLLECATKVRIGFIADDLLEIKEERDVAALHDN